MAAVSEVRSQVAHQRFRNSGRSSVDTSFHPPIHAGLWDRDASAGMEGRDIDASAGRINRKVSRTGWRVENNDTARAPGNCVWCRCHSTEGVSQIAGKRGDGLRIGTLVDRGKAPCACLSGFVEACIGGERSCEGVAYWFEDAAPIRACLSQKRPLHRSPIDRPPVFAQPQQCCSPQRLDPHRCDPSVDSCILHPSTKARFSRRRQAINAPLRCRSSCAAARNSNDLSAPSRLVVVHRPSISAAQGSRADCPN
ncbi:hypothetical protein P153DRAFT_394162 [Dothidotthia symphoricarpi CBS 119687]|uniref:Uncharacterized protein n=1 Tax=Dothidotthia symphoricarpi CBS 119687 TaxID=1392245 RepID=A0A6A6ALI7_9PLEO|nr:uncharacterized protein P153DRAFT_394162 [Dothidotthia symphoricarpi CBS 119687]KAF2131978.1 hypothetical protein P153DRAFT_394162 [Dothidotthia symphoricarpi CBS 119687]